MLRKTLCLLVVLAGQIASAQNSDYFRAPYGELLAGSGEKADLWWAPLPDGKSAGIDRRLMPKAGRLKYAPPAMRPRLRSW